MRTFQLTLLAVALGFSGAVAAQSLTAGDIAIVQMNADGTDNWAFVATTDIPGGEMISFTDNGWKADNTFRTGEGIITWTAPEEGVACGTVVTIDYNALASVGSASESGSLDFSSSGDQLLAYQGSTEAPVFLAALNNDGSAVWQSDATSSNTSALPMGLTNGVNAGAVNELDNVASTIASISDTRANILSTVYDPANWAGDDTNPQTFAGTVEVTECAPPPSCPVTTGLLASDITLNSAVLSWDDMGPDVQGYKFQLQNIAEGTNRRKTLDAGTTSLFLGPLVLSPGSDYVFAVKTLCLDGSQSAWSELYYFSTASAERMIESSMNLSVYPNPSNGSFYLNGPVTNGAQLIITDLSGKTVYTQVLDGSAELLQTDLAAGMYHLVILGGEETFHTSLVIE
ncbi:MAG: T9SS type A sorting domain-containing protein [Chitinophagales bacterium]